MHVCWVIKYNNKHHHDASVVFAYATKAKSVNDRHPNKQQHHHHHRRHNHNHHAVWGKNTTKAKLISVIRRL